MSSNVPVFFFFILDVVKIGAVAEPLQIIAHRCTPKLPPIAMIATFATFSVAYSWSCSPLLKPIRFSTRLFVVMQTLTPSPQAYTVSYDVIRYHALLLISAHFSSCSCSFLCVYIRCLPTNNAVAYSGPRINQCYCLRAPTAPPHVLGLNAYIVRPFGHPS